jgi:hypothetical protein
MVGKMDYVAVIDGGNSEFKGKNATREAHFRHALYEMTENEYSHLMARTPKGHADVFRVNGTPYAVGRLAEDKGFRERRYGSDRYVETYYGVFAAIMLFKLYERSTNNILILATHPPKDVIYRRNIEFAAKGKWTVEGQGETRSYSVRDVHKADEPVAGVMNLIINAGGRTYKHSELKQGSTLVIDVGGYTVDAVALEDGQVDYTSALSEVGGIIDVETRFLSEFRSNHAELLRSTNTFNSERVRKALTTGEFSLGGLGVRDCLQEVHIATSGVLTVIRDMYTRYGGIAQNDQIVLTGGGCGLLEKRIYDVLQHPRTLLADDAKDLRFANVRGGYRMMEVYNAQGAI